MMGLATSLVKLLVEGILLPLVGFLGLVSHLTSPQVYFIAVKVLHKRRHLRAMEEVKKM